MNRINMLILAGCLGLAFLVSAAALEVEAPLAGKRKTCDMVELLDGVVEMEMEAHANLINLIRSQDSSEDHISKCISASFNLEEPDFAGNTALHYACISGNVIAAKLLIGKGVNLDSKVRRSGNTPLHLACLYMHKEIIGLLIRAGADYTLQNNIEKTPLEIREISERAPQHIESKERIQNSEFIKSEIEKLAS